MIFSWLKASMASNLAVGSPPQPLLRHWRWAAKDEARKAADVELRAALAAEAEGHRVALAAEVEAIEGGWREGS